MKKESLSLLKQIREMHKSYPRDIELIIDSLYWEYGCKDKFPDWKDENERKRCEMGH